MKRGVNWPLHTNIIRRNSNSHTFGMVRFYADGAPKAHQGWDLHALNGTPVYTIAEGKCVFSGDRGDYGLTVVIFHPDLNLYSAYCHLSKSEVNVGQLIVCGQQIALSGSSGNASGMEREDQHLHFEIRTEQMPGKGLAGRKSPIEVFEVCPLKKPEYRT